MIDSYISEDKQESHISKRYKLYPKCRKHKKDFINVCNSCLVSADVIVTSLSPSTVNADAAAEAWLST